MNFPNSVNGLKNMRVGDNGKPPFDKHTQTHAYAHARTHKHGLREKKKFHVCD